MLFIGYFVYWLYVSKRTIGKNILFISPFIIAFIYLGRKLSLPLLLNQKISSQNYIYRLLELFDLFNAQTMIIRYGGTAIEDGRWVIAIKAAFDSFLFGRGAGVGTFTRATTGNESISGFIATHSDFLTVFIETGIIGLIIFISMLSIAIKSLLVLKNLNNEKKIIAAGIFSSLFAIIACGIVNLPFFIGESRIIWMFLGLIPVLPKYNILTK